MQCERTMLWVGLRKQKSRRESDVVRFGGVIDCTLQYYYIVMLHKKPFFQPATVCVTIIF